MHKILLLKLNKFAMNCKYVSTYKERHLSINWIRGKYTGRAIKVPHEQTFFKNIPHTFCLKIKLYLVSPVSSLSNAFYSIKFEHPIPEIFVCIMFKMCYFLNDCDDALRIRIIKLLTLLENKLWDITMYITYHRSWSMVHTYLVTKKCYLCVSC